MKNDPMAISRQCLADDGELVRVVSPAGLVKNIVMLFDEPAEDVKVGQIGGNIKDPEFQAAPEDVRDLERGWTLELEGRLFAVVKKPLPRHHDLTIIRVKEQ